MLLPKVTAIIVFLNQEKYLAEAVESVFSQTWRDWELLLVDDGSTDESTRMAREYEERYPEQVTYLEHAGHVNHGMSVSRNLGLARASGQYIAFLDGDDIWAPDKLEHQVAILDQHPEVAMAFGRLLFFTDEADIPIPEGLAPLRVPEGMLRPPIVFRQSLIGQGGMLWTTGSILFRKQALLEVGAFEEPFARLGEDAVVWLKLALAYPVYALDKFLLRYRRHNQASGIIDWRNRTLTAGWLKVIEWLYEYVQQQPASIRQWALPIVNEALFRSLIEETHSLITAPSQSFAHRCLDAFRLWLNALRRYPDIITRQRLMKLFRLVVSDVRAFLRVGTRFKKLWRALAH